MDKIPLISLFLYSLPESIILISLGMVLYGFPIKENVKKIFLFGICFTVISYYVRAWQLSFFSVIATLLLLSIFTAALTIRISLVKATFIVSTSYLIFFLAEITIPPIILKSTGLTFEQAIRDPFLRIVVPWVHLSLLGLLTIFLHRKKVSLLPAFGLLKPKTPGSKIILWQIALLSLQAMIGITVYITFYDKTYNHSISHAIFEIAWLNEISGFLLLSLSIISVVIARKLFALADQENVIAYQEVFIENANNLFNTIRDQRRDFLNHVQVLSSYVNMNLVEATKVYINNIIDETTENDEVLITDNPVLNTIIKAKMGISQRYKISLTFDIQSSLTDLNIKPFDIIKITGNLLDNAIDTVKNLEREYRKVKFTIKKQNNAYVIEVFSLPPTISSNMPDNIYKASFNTKTSEYQGTTLETIKILAEKYKGTVTVRSSEAEGIIFTVRLPEN